MGRDEERIAIMPTSREYRHRAEECLKLANETQEIYARMALLELAGDFRAMAQQLELRARRTKRQTNAKQRVSSHDVPADEFGGVAMARASALLARRS
jgi:hypothetical protein